MKSFFEKPLKFRLTIYGRVIYTITILCVFIFISFGLIFRSVNRRYLDTVIKQNGNNIGSIVEGALYYSMLKNDRSALQNTLDVINKMPGIEDVNMYDSRDNLVHSSFSADSLDHDNPNCTQCHGNLNSMFARTEKSFRIVNLDSECQMSKKNYDYRLLLIRSPILNQPSCYTAACHAHSENEDVLGSFVIRIPLNDLDGAVTKSSTDFFILAAFAVFLLIVFLIFFTRQKIINPLNGIIKASEAVSKGNKSTRLEIKPNQLYDLKMVSLAFNEMLDNLHAANIELQNWSHQLEYKVQKKEEELSEIQKELIHAERIASLGKLSSSVAHEINNPLSGILTYTKLIQKQLGKPDLDEAEKKPMYRYLSVIEKETKRCGEIVKGLLEFSKKDQHDFEAHHLHRIISDAYSLMSHQMKIAEINFYTDFSAVFDLVQCNENQIKQACIAILLNAYEAASENAEICMKTSNPDEDNIKLEITDNGVGISPEDIPHVFEPFFSAKQKASGIGLGLAIVHGIVQSHNGKVEAASEPGKGTTLSIVLPLIKNPKK